MTAVLCASRLLRFDTKRIMSPKIRPKSLGTFKKRAPASQTTQPLHVCLLSFLSQQAFSYLQSSAKLAQFFHSIIQNIQVFARVAPKQKVEYCSV